MSEMVERAARTHYEKRAESFPVSPLLGRHVLWGDLPEGMRQAECAAACAAIEAMREPTMAMIDRGSEHAGGTAAVAWRAMIDEALK